jgi:hypothetical protein
VNSLFCAILVSASIALGAPGPSRQPAAKPVGGFTAKDDARLESKIKEKLAKSKIGQDHLTVKVQGGVATWEGRTSVIQHKGAATRMAKTAGAVAVVNHIQIDEAARRKAREKMETGIRRAELKRSEPRSEPRRER